MLPRVDVVHLDVRRFDGELAALRHGISGVHRQVHDHLLDLAAVGLHGAESRGKLGGELDVFTEQPPQHPLSLADENIQVENGGLQDLLAAEREQLACQRRGTFGGFADLVDIAAMRIRRVEVLEQQLRVAGDCGEDVIEIVRHAGGEPPHGFHFLGLPELLLEREPVGDIACDAQDADEPAIAELRSCGEFPHAVVTRSRAHAQLTDRLGLGAHGAIDELEQQPEVVGMNDLLEWLANPFPRGPTGDTLERRVERHDGSIGAQCEDDVAHSLDQRVVALLRLAQRRLGAFAFGDFAHDALDAAVPEAGHTDLDHDVGAVFAPHQPFGDDVVPGGEGSQAFHRRRSIVRRVGIGDLQLQQLVARIARQLAGLAVGVDQVARRIRDQDRIGSLLDERAIACLAVPQRFLDPRLLFPRTTQGEGPQHGRRRAGSGSSSGRSPRLPP